MRFGSKTPHRRFRNFVLFNLNRPYYRVCITWRFYVWRSEFEKIIVFIVIFLENSKNFVIFTKSSNKFDEFLNFLGFSNIFLDFHVFFFIFKIFRILEKSKKFKKSIRKCMKILENSRKLKNSPKLLLLFVKITKFFKKIS